MTAIISMFFLCTLYHFSNAVEQLQPHYKESIFTLAKKFLPKNPIILEAGAYDGDDTLSMSNFWPLSKIYTFEPIPELFQKLVKKTKHKKNIFPFQLALSDTEGAVSFYLSAYMSTLQEIGASSSLLLPKEHLTMAPDVVFNKEIKVTAVTLDNWAKSNGIKNIDFLWLDLQGSELPVMKSASHIMKTVKVVYTEVEMIEAYKNQALAKDVKSWLEGQGFVLIAKDFDENKDWFGNYFFVRR